MNRFNTKDKRTYRLYEIIVGDIVKFKGTRNKGFRKILDINPTVKWDSDWESEYETIDFFSRVLAQGTFKEEPYTSTNSVDKLSHVFKDGTWFKVIKD